MYIKFQLFAKENGNLIMLTKENTDGLSIGGYCFVIDGKEIPFDWDEFVGIEEDGVFWTVDECYVSYHCEFKGKEFLMITYEMINTSADEVKTTNLVFMPPLGIRYFDINTLLPYAVETNNMLTYQIRTLWETLLAMYKANPASVKLDASERILTIED